MQKDETQLCRGCGATLTLLNRSLDMSGYCGKCAAKSQDEEDLGDLPPDVDVASIANATLRKDTTRLTLIAILSLASCFAGAVIGAMMSGPDPFGSARAADSLMYSWLFCLVGLFVGKLVFLSKGNALTFGRWKIFWGWFIFFFFLTYIPLAYFLSKLKEFPLPVDIFTFISACVVAYAFGMLFVVTKDRTLKRWYCEKCVLPSRILEIARGGDWEKAGRMIDETAQESAGLVSSQHLMARLYLTTGLEKAKASDRDAAIEDFRSAWENSGESETMRFKIGCAFNDVGEHAEACKLLSELASKGKDKDLVNRAWKTMKRIQKSHRLDLRCPKCGCRLSGTTDMIGGQATCSRCRAEFPISQDTVV